jgi:hypothetical protein
MLEFMVILMCVYGTGCAQGISSYKHYEPEQYKTIRTNTENMVYEYIDKESVATISSIALGAAKQKIKVKINKHIVFTGHYEDFMLTFKYSF